MSAPRTRRAPRAITAGIATCAVAIASATPGLARPAGHGPSRACVGCSVTPPPERMSAGVQTSSLAGTTGGTNASEPYIAGPSRENKTVIPSPDAAPAAPTRGPRIVAGDDDPTTLAVVLIAVGALFAGAGAGFAGGRRTALRTD
jgi:hypothetical protein